MTGRDYGELAITDERFPMDRKEALWLVTAILIISAIIQAPYLLAYRLAPPDDVFSGTLFQVMDVNSYMVTIRQSMAGSWLFYDLYTPEAHKPGPLYLFYIAWGKIGAVLKTSPDVTFGVARLVHGICLLLTLYWFLRLFLPDRNQRQTAFLLLVFSSGLGWILLLWGSPTVLGDRVPDFWMPEVSTFLTLNVLPHFSAATTLMLLTFGGLLLAFRRGSMAPALGAALSAFVLAWIHPFLLAVVYGVMGAYLTWHMIRRRTVMWRAVAQFGLCVAASLPVVAYLQFGVIAPNPVFQGWMDQNVNSSPNVVAYLFGFGLLVPLAAIGAVRIVRGRDRIDLFPLFWVGIGSLLLYAPFDAQRRLAEGLQIPLCLLASLGWQTLWFSLRKRRLCRPLLSGFLIAGLVTSTAVAWCSALDDALSREPPFFIPTAQVEAMRWLGDNSSWSDTVLSSYFSGVFIPAWAGKRVVLGHWAETIHLDEKERHVQRFFDASTSLKVRNEILQTYHVRFLYYGPHERRMGDYDPDFDPSWDLVFANEQVQIYRSIVP